MAENKFKNYALILIATVILSLISTLNLSIVGILFTALLASVIGYTITRYHYYFVGLVCVCSCTVYALFVGDFIVAISSLAPTLLCGISLGIAYNLKFTEFKTISLLSCVYVIYLLLSVKIIGVDENNLNIIEKTFKESSEVYKNVLLATYAGEFSQAEISKLMSEIMTTMMKFMPSFILIICIVIAIFIFYIFKKILKITKSDLSVFKPFSEWQFDKSLGIIYIIVAIMIFIAPKGYIADAFANVLAVSTFIFYVLGLSFIDFLLKSRMNNSAPRKILLFFIATLPIFALGLPFIFICILGLFDCLINLKEKSLKK